MAKVSQKRPGFTLVELLVVVGIIGILIGILLPVLTSMRQMAIQINCMSILRQWATCYQMYTHDNHGFLPREKAIPPGFDGTWRAETGNSWEITKEPENGDIWYNALPRAYLKQKRVAEYAADASSRLAFYVRGAGNLFHCPAADLDAPTLSMLPCFSIGVNSKLGKTGQRAKISEIRKPTLTPLFVEGGLPGEVKYHASQGAFDGRPHIFVNRMAFRHQGRANMAMADGHVVAFEVSQVLNLNSTSSPGGAIFPQINIVWTLNPNEDPNNK